MRKDKINYYLDIADVVSNQCTCLRRRYGAVIVKAPRGRQNCTDLGYCVRQKLNIPRGERYELCRSVHAESNAIISAERAKMVDSTLYLSGREVDTNEIIKNSICCSMCKRLVINAGIKTVIVRDTPEEYRVIDVADWIKNDESIAGEFGY